MADNTKKTQEQTDDYTGLPLFDRAKKNNKKEGK